MMTAKTGSWSDGTEGDRCGVSQQGEHRRTDRFKAKARHDGSRDGHRRTEPGNALDQGAKAKGDDKSLDPAIFRQAGERPLDDIEVSARDREVMEESALRTTQLIGHSPKAMPSVVADISRPTDMPQPTAASRAAVSMAVNAVSQAGRRQTASIRNRT
jgi:hypothetical protein